MDFIPLHAILALAVIVASKWQLESIKQLTLPRLVATYSAARILHDPAAPC